MCTRKNNYPSSKRASQSSADSLSQSFLSKQQSFTISACVAYMREKGSKGNIHHAVCSLEGERWLQGPATRTVFQYHGCHWHGCRRCFTKNRDKIVTTKLATVECTRALRASGWLARLLRNGSVRIKKCEKFKTGNKNLPTRDLL